MVFNDNETKNTVLDTITKSFKVNHLVKEMNINVDDAIVAKCLI
jgi:hypothetical protein